MSRKDSTGSDKSPERKQENKDGGKSIKTRFDEYAAFQDGESFGSISLSNLQLWLKQAALLDNEDGISEAETVKAFEKISKGKNRINFFEFENLMEVVSGIVKMDMDEFTKKLILATEPTSISGLFPPIKGKTNSLHLEMHANKDQDEVDLDVTEKNASVSEDIDEDKNKQI